MIPSQGICVEDLNIAHVDMYRFGYEMFVSNFHKVKQVKMSPHYIN